MKKGMCWVHKITALLLWIGGINWGLVALNPSWNVVDMLLGAGSTAARVVYGLVGVSALLMLAACKCCMGGCGKCGAGMCKGGSCKGAMPSAGGGSCSGGQKM